MLDQSLRSSHFFISGPGRVKFHVKFLFLLNFHILWPWPSIQSKVKRSYLEATITRSLLKGPYQEIFLHIKDIKFLTIKNTNQNSFWIPLYFQIKIFFKFKILGTQMMPMLTELVFQMVSTFPKFVFKMVQMLPDCVT